LTPNGEVVISNHKNAGNFVFYHDFSWLVVTFAPLKYIQNQSVRCMSKVSLLLVVIISIVMVACNKEQEISGTEEEQIERYIKSKNLTITEKTVSGLRYILTKANATGASLKVGQIVTVKYAGRLLSDKSFDSGTFNFNLGLGQVVAGFDEGIAKMKVGESATLIFPSSLGYGSRGAGSDIPGNSPLVFDIEVVSAK
jgi:FKBP-type peptidyl-prolyl cis-trans isomerase